MKKIFTILTFVAAILTIYGLAGVTAHSEPNLVLLSYDDQPVKGTVDDDMAIHGKIKNANFFDAITVGLNIYVHEIQPGQGLLICWGETCLPPVIKTGPISFIDNYVLQAQQESGNNFKCGIEQGGVLGNIRVTFTFFDVNNKNDSVTFTSTAEVVTDISDVKEQFQTINISPNPADEFLNISINRDNYIALNISDLSGTSLQNLKLTQDMQTLSINTSEFAPGVYFITFYTNTGSVEIRKFIVAR